MQLGHDVTADEAGRARDENDGHGLDPRGRAGTVASSDARARRPRTATASSARRGDAKGGAPSPPRRLAPDRDRARAGPDTRVDAPRTYAGDARRARRPRADRLQAELLQRFDLPIALLQDAEALERVASELVESKAADGVRYVEVRWGPALHTERGLSLADGIAAVCRGAARGGDADRGRGRPADLHRASVARPGPQRRAGRDGGPVPGPGLVGWDLAGGEERFPDPLRFDRAFAVARAGGLRITLHAGEWGGAAQVRRALAVDPERIAHGPGAIDDPALIAELIARGVTLDLCPTSNVQAGIVASLAAHPLARLHRAGVSVTLSTDDATVSDIDLSEEYVRAVERIGLSLPELWAIDLRALDVAFGERSVARAAPGRVRGLGGPRAGARRGPRLSRCDARRVRRRSAPASASRIVASSAASGATAVGRSAGGQRVELGLGRDAGQHEDAAGADRPSSREVGHDPVTDHHRVPRVGPDHVGGLLQQQWLRLSDRDRPGRPRRSRRPPRSRRHRASGGARSDRPGRDSSTMNRAPARAVVGGHRQPAVGDVRIEPDDDGVRATGRLEAVDALLFDARGGLGGRDDLEAEVGRAPGRVRRRRTPAPGAAAGPARPATGPSPAAS